MDLKNIRKNKQATEKHIIAVLEEFERDTELRIKGIRYRREKYIDTKNVHEFKIIVDL